ncbi:hypothetical protein HKX48_003206, partial [Thoreauomyces humboldtii]
MTFPTFTPTVIASGILFLLALVVGITNLVHVFRRDIIEHWRRRSPITCISQVIMLVSFVLSSRKAFLYVRDVQDGGSSTNGISMGSDANLEDRETDRQFDFSDATLIMGSFLLVHAIQSLLPAVQIRMKYSPRWNVALRILTFVLFLVVMGGWCWTTVSIGAAAPSASVPPSDVADMRSTRVVFFTIWAIYAPILCIAISILVIRLLVSMKTSLVAVGQAHRMLDDGNGDGDGVRSPERILGDIRRKA